jgi:uncharacterized protein YggE
MINRILCIGLLLLVFTSTSNAELPLPKQAHIIVNGYGATDQIPDLIIIRFEVAATAKNFSLAKQSVDGTIAKAINATKKQGVAEDNINASKINASPQYEWQDKDRVYKGERVSRQVEIKLTEANRYNDLVDALLAAGISRLQPVQLDFTLRDELENKALLLALDDAKQKAQSMAEHLGSSIGRVFQIAPLERARFSNRMAMAVSEDSGNDKSPLKLGKQKLEQKIRVVYLLNK